ncbi:MAG TPA: DUF3618 domain-containing protein [Kiloniellales bacterium]|nr:DUF3618 domain-containing protein [Kiloniellales bacterium]
MSERLDDLERRISNERRQIDGTLEELEHRLSPQRLMHQAVSYLKHGGASLLGDWSRAMRRNPFPLALTAAGLTLVPALRRHSVPLALTTVGLTLMARSVADERGQQPSAGRWDEWQGQSYDSDDDRYRRHREGLLHRARRVAQELRQQIDETAEAFAERVAHAQAEVLGLARHGGESASEFASRVSRMLNEGAQGVVEGVTQTAEAAGHFAGRVSSTVGHGAQSVKESVVHGIERAGDLAGRASTAVGHGAHNVKESVMHTAEQARELVHRGREQAGTFLREQPLLAIAIGVGFGALLGALLPTTPMERRNLGALAGRARDEVKQTVRDLGESAERVAGDAVEAATAGAERVMHQWEGEGPQRSRH